MSLNEWLKLEQDNKGLKLTILRIFMPFYAAQIRPTRFAYFSACTIWSKKARPGQQVKKGTHQWQCSFRGFRRRVSGCVLNLDPFWVFLALGVGHPDHPDPSCIQLGPWKSPSACLCVLFTSVKTKVRPRMRKENPADKSPNPFEVLTPLCRSWRFRVFSGLP